VRDAVLHVLRAAGGEAVPGVEANQVRLRLQDARAVPDHGHRLGHQPGGMPAAARRRGHHDPADPLHAAGVGQDPQVRHRRAVVGQPEMPGARFDVPPVEFRVRARLLHHEHVDA
jgi:hypothetical protein